MKSDAQADIAFLRDLVLRADVDRGIGARIFLLWGLTWAAVYGLGAAFPGSWLVAALSAVLVLGVAFGPWVRFRIDVAHRGAEAGLGPLPLLGRVFYAAIGGTALLAYGLVWTLHAWTAVPVQDGGIWLLIIGAAFLVGSMFVRGLFGWLGTWLFLVGIVIPSVLPGLREASVGYAALGGGGLLVAAAVSWRLLR